MMTLTKNNERNLEIMENMNKNYARSMDVVEKMFDRNVDCVSEIKKGQDQMRIMMEQQNIQHQKLLSAFINVISNQCRDAVSYFKRQI